VLFSTRTRAYQTQLLCPVEAEVARVLAERRECPVRAVVDALEAFAQPELIIADESPVVTASVEHPRLWQRLFKVAKPAPLNSMPILPEPRTVLAPMPLVLN
jgi:hypothetical protein